MNEQDTKATSSIYMKQELFLQTARDVFMVMIKLKEWKSIFSSMVEVKEVISEKQSEES